MIVHTTATAATPKPDLDWALQNGRQGEVSLEKGNKGVCPAT